MICRHGFFLLPMSILLLAILSWADSGVLVPEESVHPNHVWRATAEGNSMKETGSHKKIASNSWKKRYKPLGKKKKQTRQTQEIIKKNKEISEDVGSFFKGVDLFLSGEKVSPKKNESQLVLSTRFDFREGGETSVQPHVDIDLKLPNLEKKLKLKLSSYDDSEAGQGVERNRVEGPQQKESYGTSVEFSEKISSYKVSFRPRLQLSPKLGMSYLLRFSKDVSFSRRVTFLPSYSFFAKPELGTGVFLSFNTVFNTGPFSSFDVINEGEYSNFENLLSVNNGLAYRQPVQKRKIYLVHSLLFESTNRPNYHLDQIVVSTGYYHKILFKVFHYAITPYLSFAKEEDFKGKFGVRFDLNVIF